MAESYTLRDLIAAASAAERLSLSERAVRQYLADGLLPPPRGQGLTATYSAEHLAHLRLVLRLVNQYVPLPEIRRWMQSLTAHQILALLERPAVPRLPVEGDAPTYLSRLLRTLPPSVQVPATQSGVSAQTRRQGLRQMLRPQGTEKGPVSPRDARETWIHVAVSPDVQLLLRAGSAPAEHGADRLVEAVQRALRSEVGTEGETS